MENPIVYVGRIVDFSGVIHFLPIKFIIMEPDFGRAINIRKANKLYVDMQNIKNRTRQTIVDAFQDDPVALNFYLGYEIAFVFSKQSIEKLAKIIEPLDEGSGVLFYTGVRDDNNGNSTGRPTVMAFAYNTFINGVTNEKRISVITQATKEEIVYSEVEKDFIAKDSNTLIPLNQDDGEEHPGGGSTNTSGVMPTSFDLSQIQPFM